MGLPKEATYWLQEALTLTERYPEEVETRRHVLSSLGNLYFYSCNYDAAIKLYRELYDYCATDKDKAIALSHIASYYSVKEQRDSTFAIQDRALAHAFASKDSFIIAACLYSVGLDHYYVDNNDSALYYIRRALKEAPVDFPRGSCYGQLGSIFSENESTQDSALYYINKSQSDTTFQGRFLGLLDLAEIEESRMNYKAANYYLHQYVDYADSLIFSEQSTPMIRLIHEYQTKMRVREAQIRGQRIFWGGMGIGAVLIFAVILGFQYQLNRKKRRQEIYEQRLKQTQEKITLLQATIETNEELLGLLQKEKLQYVSEADKLENAIRKYREEKNTLQEWLFHESTVFKKVQSLRKQWVGGNKEQKVLNSADQEKLREIVRNVFVEKIKELRQLYPRLTEDDIFLLCLQEIGFDSQGIAICFGYGDTHVINQRKSRMKGRMEALEEQV